MNGIVGGRLGRQGGDVGDRPSGHTLALRMLRRTWGWRTACSARGLLVLEHSSALLPTFAETEEWPHLLKVSPQKRNISATLTKRQMTNEL